MLRTALLRPSFHCASCISTSRFVPVHPAFRNHFRLFSTSPEAPKPTDESRPDPPQTESPRPEFPRPEPSRPLEHEKRTSHVDGIHKIRKHVSEWSTGTASTLRQQIDIHTANLAQSFSQLGKEINRVTGYGEIEELKRRVVAQESRIEAVRRAAREAKEAYDTAVRQRASSQREVNDLLQRKSTWADRDVVRFTELVRKDHLFEQEETRAKLAAAAAEDAVELEFSELMRVILNRYHEEQAWSDKIRSASTYGSLAVMGVNMFVFILAIVLVEPWKRRRLAQTFERKVEEMSAQNAALLESKTDAVAKRMDAQDRMLSQLMETVYYSTRVPQADPPVLSEAPAVHIEKQWTSTLPELLQSDRAVAVAIAATAGLIGWLARSWYG